jgi:hypothetical protein
MKGEAAGEDSDSRWQRAAAEDVVGAALVDVRVEVGARHQQRRVEEEDDGGGQQQRPALPAHLSQRPRDLLTAAAATSGKGGGIWMLQRPMLPTKLAFIYCKKCHQSINVFALQFFSNKLLPSPCKM